MKRLINLKFLVQIKVYPETRERLRKHGMKGETYDIVINRILDNVEKEKQ